MEFKTQASPRERVISNPGSRFAPEFKVKVADNGSFSLTEAGKTDFYEKIQSYREECDIKAIIARYLSGDETALNKYAPLFGDFRNAPTTLAEYYQRIFDAEDIFMKLPPDVRKIYNYSLSEFLAAVGTQDFNKLFNIKPDSSVPVEEVKSSVDEKGDEE